MNFLKKSLRIILILLMIPVIGLVILFLNFKFISFTANDNLYNKISDIPSQTYSLVLGAGHYKPELWTNYNLLHRIDAASELYFHSKTEKIIVSGRRYNEKYDEARDMKKMLLEKGIPESVIIVDSIGKRTWISINNCKTIYALDNIIIISQQDHLERAVFIAKCLNLNATGFIAKEPPWNHRNLKNRESLARIRAIIDCMINNINF